MITPKFIEGNLTADPELKTYGDGKTLCRLAIAENDSMYNREQGQYITTATNYVHGVIFDERLANNVAHTLRKGMGVLAYAKPHNNYTDDQGNKRSTVDYTILAIGPSLRRQYGQMIPNQQPNASTATSGNGTPAGGSPWNDNTPSQYANTTAPTYGGNGNWNDADEEPAF